MAGSVGIFWGIPEPGNSSNYLLENRKAEAVQRFAALSALFDPVTLRQFDACCMASGWHCWEVGAGGVALVQAVAERVGHAGRILATDIDDSWVKEAASPNVEVRKHDVARDPPPSELFDLVHARLVLVHVPERELAFQNMVSALKPGGWLVIEDADPALQPLSCIDAYGPEQELANRIRQGFRTLLSARGVDLFFGRKLPRMFRQANMANIAAEAYFPIALPECISLEIATIRMIRNDLLSNGIATDHEIERHLENVQSGTLDLSQPPMISVRGCKPR
ncbi:MAG: methyltransferase domain-containing protein [Betaproteobacteria bacterium]|nr:methyltransferase domain-containing protein [Betaproteobacteria bacterium]